jgi:hypothetical protein
MISTGSPNNSCETISLWSLGALRKGALAKKQKAYLSLAWIK